MTSRDSKAGLPDDNDSKTVLPELSSIRRSRLKSLWIAHVTLFIFSTGFSIVLTGIYPYMKQVNKS